MAGRITTRRKTLNIFQPQNRFIEEKGKRKLIKKKRKGRQQEGKEMVKGYYPDTEGSGLLEGEEEVQKEGAVKGWKERRWFNRP